jgi:phosphate transport system permease protein
MAITKADSLKIGPQARSIGPASRISRWRTTKNSIARTVLLSASLLLILLLISIGYVLVREAMPILSVTPLRQIATSLEWHPTRGAFGLAPFIIGSFAVTLMAMVLGVVPAVFSGIYLAEYTSSRRRASFKPVVDLLAGIPSVVYGLWGILFVVPLIREVIAPYLGGTLGQRFPLFAVNNPSGYSVLAAGIVLAIMVFPLIVAVTDEVLRSIPQHMRESTFALGATRWETTWCVVRNAGLPGIFASIVLAFSRAFGETLAVMMVVGNTAQIPSSIFDAAYPLPALIANAYSEMMSIPLYQSALMLAALILMAFVLLFNIFARLFIVRMTKGR